MSNTATTRDFAIAPESRPLPVAIVEHHPADAPVPGTVPATPYDPYRPLQHLPGPAPTVFRSPPDISGGYGTLDADLTAAQFATVAGSRANRWYRVDVDFEKEFLNYRFFIEKQKRSETKKIFFSRSARFVIPALVVAGFAYSYWSSRLTCSRQDVQRVAADLAKDKLLKITSGDVALHSIATVGSLDSGGVKCSAEIEISGAGAETPSFRTMEYSAENRENGIYVIGRVTQ